MPAPLRHEIEMEPLAREAYLKEKNPSNGKKVGYTYVTQQTSLEHQLMAL